MPKTMFDFVTLAIVILIVAYFKRDDLKNAFSKQPNDVELEEGFETLESIKSHYIRLVDLCIHKNSSNEALIKHIQSIKNAKTPEHPDAIEDEMSDEVYFSNILYNVMDAPGGAPLQLIYTLDWKDDITELVLWIEAALGDDIKNMNLPDINDYPKNKLLSDRTIRDYQEALLKHDIVMGFIHTDHDALYFMFHRISDKEEVQNLLQRVGLTYY